MAGARKKARAAAGGSGGGGNGKVRGGTTGGQGGNNSGNSTSSSSRASPASPTSPASPASPASLTPLLPLLSLDTTITNNIPSTFNESTAGGRPSPSITSPTTTTPTTTDTATISAQILDMLQIEFPTLESTLVAAIHSDYPLDPSTTRAILLSLSERTILGEDDCPITTKSHDTTTRKSSSTSTGSVADEYTSVGSSSWASTTGDDDVLDGGDWEGGDDLVVLKKMFPSLKDITLVRALERANGGKGRVEAAVDELLNRVFFDGEGGGGDDEECQWRGLGKGVDGFEAHEGVGSGKRKERGKVGKDKGKGRLVPVGGVWLRAGAGGMEQERREMEKENGSRWDVIQRDISFLSAALHVPQQMVASACHAAGGDIAETVYKVVDKLPPSPSSTPRVQAWGGLLDTEPEAGAGFKGQEREVLELLGSSFPDVEGRVLRGLWRLAVGRELREGSPCSSTAGSGGNSSPVGIPPLPPVGRGLGGWSVTGRGGGQGYTRTHAHPQPQLPRKQEPDNSVKAESAISDLFTIAAILQNTPRNSPPATQTPTTPTGTFPHPPRRHHPTPPSHTHQQTITINPRSPSSPSPFHTHTTTHSLEQITSSLQHALRSSAALSKRGRDTGMRAAAAYYSLHARHLTSSLRDMEVERALRGVSTHDDENLRVVDLHGLRLTEGVSVAREVVQGYFLRDRREREENYGGARRGRGRVRVITGKGRHSQGGKGVLGPGVVKMLRGEGWRVEVGSGWVEVLGRN